MLEHGCRGDACFAEGIVTLIVYHLVFMVTQAGRWSRSRCKTNPVRVERETHIVPSSKGGVHPRAKFPAPSRKFPAPDRDRGESRDSSPPTPPDVRVRIRRFGGLSRPRHRDGSQAKGPQGASG